MFLLVFVWLCVAARHWHPRGLCAEICVMFGVLLRCFVRWLSSSPVTSAELASQEHRCVRATFWMVSDAGPSGLAAQTVVVCHVWWFCTA
jgi:hypothetical protein